MIHESNILDQLSKLDIVEFSGEVYRATRKSLDPLAASTNGGRWMPKGESSVLYTSLDRDAALAELTFHWGMLNPLPSKPAVVSRIQVSLDSSLRILRTDFPSLGINEVDYDKLNYVQMQKVGAAAAFLDCQGLIVPCARWSCENLIIFTDNLASVGIISIVDEAEVDWQRWGRENSRL